MTPNQKRDTLAIVFASEALEEVHAIPCITKVVNRFSVADGPVAFALPTAAVASETGMALIEFGIVSQGSVMKTMTILLIGTAIGWAAPAHAQCPHDVLQRASQAHALSARIAATTVPFGQVNAGWDRASQRALAANAAAELLLATLQAGDFCAAYDAALRLNSLADDLKDATEDLRPFHSPYGPGPCRDDARQVEDLADHLEELAEDLRRDTKRLDQSRVLPPVYNTPPLCGTAVPSYQPIQPPYGSRVPLGQSPIHSNDQFWQENGSAQPHSGYQFPGRRNGSSFVVPPQVISPDQQPLLYGPGSGYRESEIPTTSRVRKSPAGVSLRPPITPGPFRSASHRFGW